jgi:hypothetical protein
MKYYTKAFHPVETASLETEMQEWFDENDGIILETTLRVRDGYILCIYQKEDIWKKNIVHVKMEP